MSCEEIFLAELRGRGLRLTPQREMILSVMHRIEGFATVEQIYGRVQALSAAVDVSTVYRTLDLLQELRLVNSVDLGDGQCQYELVSTHDPHVHLVCSACGAVLGADLAPVQALADHLQAAYGFHLDPARLSLPGICRGCAEKG